MRGGGSGKGTSLVHAHPSHIPQAAFQETCIQPGLHREAVIGNGKASNQQLHEPARPSLGCGRGLPSRVNTMPPLLCCHGYQIGQGLVGGTEVQASVMGAILDDTRRRPRKPKICPMAMLSALVGGNDGEQAAHQRAVLEWELARPLSTVSLSGLAHKGSKLCQSKVPASCPASQTVRVGRPQRSLSQPGLLEGRKATSRLSNIADLPGCTRH